MIVESQGQGNMFGFDQPITAAEILGMMQENTNVLYWTRKMVAHKLGRAKSPSLVRKLHELCDEGLLEWGYHTLPNSVNMYVYFLPKP